MKPIRSTRSFGPTFHLARRAGGLKEISTWV